MNGVKKELEYPVLKEGNMSGKGEGKIWNLAENIVFIHCRPISLTSNIMEKKIN